MKKILFLLVAAVSLVVACICTSSCTGITGNEKGVYSFSVENVTYTTTDSKRLAHMSACFP